MINNRQVNIWRGSDPPPTIYHIWIKNDSQLLLYNGTTWEVFLDNEYVVQALEKFQQNLESLQNSTVNNKKIIDNPVLGGSDILTDLNGSYITKDDTIARSLQKLDELLQTQVITE